MKLYFGCTNHQKFMKSWKFILSKDYSKEENLNILTRILIIVFIVCIFLNCMKKEMKYILLTTFIPLLLIFLIVIFYIMTVQK